MPDPGELHRALLDELAERGDLSSDWGDAFAAVPRHVFLPDTVWWQDEKIDGAVDLVPLRRWEEPEVWIAMAYSNQAVITQVDDGEPVGSGLLGYDITSSASMPTVVAVMLGKLHVQPGMSVLEIGTGNRLQCGAAGRRLWDEVEAAYRWWVEQDEPSVHRWLITVDAGGQRVTLD